MGYISGNAFVPDVAVSRGMWNKRQPGVKIGMLWCRFLSEVGTVSATQQRKELFGEVIADTAPLGDSTVPAGVSDNRSDAPEGGKKQQ